MNKKKKKKKKNKKKKKKKATSIAKHISNVQFSFKSLPWLSVSTLLGCLLTGMDPSQCEFIDQVGLSSTIYSQHIDLFSFKDLGSNYKIKLSSSFRL